MQQSSAVLIRRYLIISSQGIRSMVVVLLDYAGDDDFNKSLPKARLSFDEVFVNLDG